MTGAGAGVVACGDGATEATVVSGLAGAGFAGVGAAVCGTICFGPAVATDVVAGEVFGAVVVAEGFCGVGAICFVEAVVAIVLAGGAGTGFAAIGAVFGVMDFVTEDAGGGVVDAVTEGLVAAGAGAKGKTVAGFVGADVVAGLAGVMLVGGGGAASSFASSSSDGAGL